MDCFCSSNDVFCQTLPMMIVVMPQSFYKLYWQKKAAINRDSTMYYANYELCNYHIHDDEIKTCLNYVTF